jgi:hypothetical protein
MDVRNYIKSLLALKCITLTQLAKMMSEKTGEKYNIKSLSGKLTRETITMKEVFIIAELIGYEIKFIEKK